MSAMHFKNVFSISFLSQQIRAVGTEEAIASNILADQFTLLQIWGRLYPPYYCLLPPSGFSILLTVLSLFAQVGKCISYLLAIIV